MNENIYLKDRQQQKKNIDTLQWCNWMLLKSKIADFQSRVYFVIKYYSYTFISNHFQPNTALCIIFFIYRICLQTIILTKSILISFFCVDIICFYVYSLSSVSELKQWQWLVCTQ